MKFQIFFCVIAIVIFSIDSFGQNKINSRLFYLKPPLHNSKSKISKLNLSRYDVTVSLPKDDRAKFIGEVVYKKIKVHPLDEFFQSPTMIEIQNKIQSDLKKFGSGSARAKPHQKLVVEPTVEVFYPKVSGFLNGKAFAKVRLVLAVLRNDSLVMNNTCESFYITDGIDKEFEGNLQMSVEDGINVTLGMALRQALDQFYSDLNEGLRLTGSKMMIAGKVVNSKTGNGLAATIAIKSDTLISTISSAEGRYRLTIPYSTHYTVQVVAPDFVTFSEQLSIPTSSLKMMEKNFKLQPAEKGIVVSLKNVLFYMGTTDLLETAYHELDGVVAFLKAHPKIKIKLQGHTDNQGSTTKDLILSQERVDKIKSYLVSAGINARRIKGKGFGGTKPIASNNSEEGRKLNRRVEFVILKN